ncbi:hypothetical protein [Saccharopolyspora sp. NPDC002376]
MFELFTATDLIAGERLRQIDAEQVPGQMTVSDCIAEIEAEQQTGELVEIVDAGPVMPVSPVELFSVEELRGQLVLA